VPGALLVELKKIYLFEAAHFLPRVPAGHKCSRMHGHSYRVEIGLRGPVDATTGWVVDFAVIDDAWVELFRQFDHHVLNEIAGLDNPTCENLCAFVWKAMAGRVPHLDMVTVWETADSCCTLRGFAG
jgi:6-pyruvoyltetrahydropterin/6-carboxytetrahydropterin synthase